MPRSVQARAIGELLGGRILTNIGDSIIYMSVLWYFNQRVHAAFFVTSIFVITSGVDALSFLLGPILDRVRVRSLLWWTTISQVLLAGLLVAGMASHLGPRLVGGWLLIFLLLSTISSALIYPTEDKLLPLLAEKQALLRVNGLFQLSYQTLDLFLDGLISIVLSYLTVGTTLFLAVPIFGIAALVFRALRVGRTVIPGTETEGHYGHLLKTGWVTLVQHPFMLRALIPFAILNLFFGAADAAMPQLATHYLSQRAWGYGALLTGISIGGLLGALVVQRLTFTGRRLIRFAGWCLLAGGLCRSVLWLSQVPWVMLGAITINAFWISMMNVNFIAFVQSSFSPAVLGGWLVTTTGVLGPQLLYSTMTILCGAYFVWYLVRHVDGEL